MERTSTSAILGYFLSLTLSLNHFPCIDLVCRGLGKTSIPRLRELAPKDRGGQEAESHNPGIELLLNSGSPLEMYLFHGSFPNALNTLVLKFNQGAAVDSKWKFHHCKFACLTVSQKRLKQSQQNPYSQMTNASLLTVLHLLPTQWSQQIHSGVFFPTFVWSSWNFEMLHWS